MFAKASNVVVVCTTVIAVVLIGVMGFLVFENRLSLPDVMSFVSGLGALGAWLYSSAGSQSAHNVETQINGAMDKRIQGAIDAALLKHTQSMAQQPTTVVVTPQATPEVHDGQ